MPLVLVPTPLGNLRDITLRSLDALRDAEIVVAEDTRVARKLLFALGIGTKECWSYREQNAASVTEGILERARGGNVVLVTDAGMPGISDPGSALVAAARAAGVPVDLLPGPSAALGVAVLSGFDLRRFLFEGFVPRTQRDRRAAFGRALRGGITTIWYESPKRIHATLADLQELAPDARVFVLREYTKLFEQQVLGSPAGVAAAIAEPVRGEIAFALAPLERTSTPPAATPEQIDERIDGCLDEGRSIADIARLLAQEGLGERRELYARASERKKRARQGRPVG